MTSRHCTLVTALILATCNAAFAQVYVDTNVITPGTGNTWETAFRHLQDAIEAASEGDQVWVAAGTYYPDRNAAAPTGTGNRDATFSLDKGLRVNGGFLGGETDPNQRDFADPLALTVLSGEIADPALVTDNSHHVVSAMDVSGVARLDGFTVTGGQADIANKDAGAGILIDHTSEVVIANCHVAANVAGNRDSNESASGFGGGIAVVNNPSGPQNGPFPDVRILDCVIEGNRAIGDPGSGGGVGVTHLAEVFVVNTVIADNRAEAYLFEGQCDVVFAPRGGGVHTAGIADLRNCTITENEAEQGCDGTGGGLTAEGNGSLLLANCVVWGNLDECTMNCTAASQITLFGSAGAVVDFSDVQGGWTGAGVGNIDADPLFAGDYELSAASPALDTGHRCFVPTDDDDVDADTLTMGERTPDRETTSSVHTDRITGDDVDMGAYERPGAPYCDGDLNENGAVDYADILAVIAAWGPCSACTEDLVPTCGEVGYAEIAFVIGRWGSCAAAAQQVELPDVVAEAGLTMEDWGILMDVLDTGTRADRANARCWVEHYHAGCASPCAHHGCPGADPFGRH